MKTKLTMLAFIFVASLNAQEIKVETLEMKRDGELVKYRKMTVNGVYNGKDIFIRNSFGGNGIGFCVSQVNVNKNITTDEINASVFSVDLEMHKLKLNEKFTMEVFYKEKCEVPSGILLLNPGAIKQKDPSGNNVLVVEGKSFDQNLMVVNPRSGKGVYGIKEVSVNGKKVEGINKDVFQIELYKMKIKYEERIKIEFKYEDDCDPFIINPEVINY
jgi:hypothetical protein